MLPFKQGACILAPMVGITNRAFRTLVAELGAPDYAFTEMAGAEAFLSGEPHGDAWLDPAPAPGATSVQFYAKGPERLAEACARLAGFPENRRPRGIDINLGCSAPGIRRSGGGSAWSADPEGTVRLVAAARAAWPGILSVKLRSGPDQDIARLLSHCGRLAAAGLDFITLHPRTDSQKFRRAAMAGLVGELAAGLPIPVVGNGDIRKASDVAAMFERQRPAAVMVGREAARRPWFFALLRSRESDPGAVFEADSGAVALRYLELVETLLPHEWRLDAARRFFSYFAENFRFSHHIKWKLVNAPSLAAQRAALRDYLAEVPEDRVLRSDD